MHENRLASIALITTAFLWCGLVVGISFVSTPLKFHAPNMTLELGLGIGQLVFGTLIKIESVLAILVGFCLWKIRASGPAFVLLCLAILILCVQSWVLLPILDQRLELVLQGQPPPESWHHWAYIIIEGVKVFSLLVGGILFLKDRL